MRIIQTSNNTTWQKYINLFLQAMKKSDLMPKTVSAYQHDLFLFIKWLLAINSSRKLSALTEIDIIEYRQQLISSGLKPATVNRRLGSIQRFCRWSVGSKLLQNDVSKSIKQVNVVSKRCPSGLKPSEVQLLLQMAGQSKHGHAKRNYALLHLMLQTGLRVNEVAQLKIKDVELGDRSGMVYVRLGKGRKARDIPLNTKARRAMKLYLSLKDNENEKDYVFLSERHTSLSARSIQAVINTLANRANITRIKVSPHTLRHTFAINYLKQHPSNIVQLANLLGHESLDTTAIYTRPDLEDLANNLELMAAG